MTEKECTDIDPNKLSYQIRIATKRVSIKQAPHALKTLNDTKIRARFGPYCTKQKKP